MLSRNFGRIFLKGGVWGQLLILRDAKCKHDLRYRITLIVIALSGPRAHKGPYPTIMIILHRQYTPFRGTMFDQVSLAADAVF